MNIYQKLVEVRKQVPYLKKEAEGHQYSYTGSSQVLAAVRLKMDELGLLLVPKIINPILHEKGATNSKEHLTELVMEFTWINAEKPEEMIVIPWYGQGLDTGEKGVGKALTYAEKYFLLKQFNIATDKMDVDAFQEKYERSAARITSNAVAQLKTEWLGAGHKLPALTQRVRDLYGCGLNELNEEQADELIAKIREKKAGKSA